MPNVVERDWNEFWAVYYRIEHRHGIPGIFEWDRKLVRFIETVCGLSPGQRILDLGCGGGDQAKLFAEKGYTIVGIDIAPSLIQFAEDQFKKTGLKGTFIAGDMRAIDYDSEFDACLILSGTFGFFGEEEDQGLLSSISRALRTGGKLFVMFSSANRRTERSRTWLESQYGWELRESWVEAETSTSCGRTFILQRDGTRIVPKSEAGYHANERIRCYTVPEMKAKLRYAGLRFVASYSDTNLDVPPEALDPESVRNIVVAERV
jgi:ubiquinone/menaquinone biosynthesis C-methylase UbiE